MSNKRKFLPIEFLSEQELNPIYWEKYKGLRSDGNIYLAFIEEAKKKAECLLSKNPKLYLEIHHILPRHAGGEDSQENLVKLTFEDHILAHYIRWVFLKNPKDRYAYRMMSTQNGDVRRERAVLGGKIGGPRTQQILKENNKGWYNSFYLIYQINLIKENNLREVKKAQKPIEKIKQVLGIQKILKKQIKSSQKIQKLLLNKKRKICLEVFKHKKKRE
uniref:Putative HNH homing endonuclease n=1 Tax=Golenkinia longispicula TaxID=204992 RepID=A0A0S2ID00_9CHLO|nr:putative HNH homing endonuclease [Golenkinia longispicula]